MIHYTEETDLHKTSYTIYTPHALTFESEPEHRQISSALSWALFKTCQEVFCFKWPKKDENSQFKRFSTFKSILDIYIGHTLESFQILGEVNAHNYSGAEGKTDLFRPCICLTLKRGYDAYSLWHPDCSESHVVVTIPWFVCSTSAPGTVFRDCERRTVSVW